MCRVVGYVGKKLSRAYVLEGLSRLEYGGYDSSGFACIQPKQNKLAYTKVKGGISGLIKQFQENPMDGFVGIGHTRWATHGIASVENAHPHFDCTKSISAVHNGIIENYHKLREQLVSRGHIFHSQTDTECATHLLEEILESGTKELKDYIVELVSKLEGAFAIVFLLEKYPDQMILIRQKSPLCIGIGDDEMFIASDPLAFAGLTNQVVFLPDASFALVNKSKIELFDFNGTRMHLAIQPLNINWSNDGKQGYEHFMLKEIYEQKRVIQDTVYAYKESEDYIFTQMNLSISQIKSLEHIHFVACGTSAHAAMIAQYFFENICNISTQVSLGSEFRYKKLFKKENSLYIGISQSGETADTLESIRFINGHDEKSLIITNVASSTMVREAMGFLLTHAGPEIAVASTKAFTAQVATLYWFANFIAYHKNLIDYETLQNSETELVLVSNLIEDSIEKYKNDITQKLAKKYSSYAQAIFLGRNISFPLALESALKLKEIAYIFTDAYLAGELKHGSLALIDNDVPVYIFSVLDPLIYKKILSNAQEVKARNGHIIAFAFEEQKELIDLADLAFVFPHVNEYLGTLLMIPLIQFFIYNIAKELNRPIDKPRNLAKSVTVE